MIREKALDRATIDTYHDWVQQGIRNELNSIGLGPGKLPYRFALSLIFFGFCNLLVGILLVALRMRHVYLWDWDAQFLGPFFFIMFLLCLSGGTYLIILAKRRSNRYRSELYFRPVGDWGVNCVHKSELARDDEIKHDLKSGTTPHKTIKPSSEAYSKSNQDARKAAKQREGQDNRGYDRTPTDAKPFRPEREKRPPPNGQRGPPPADGRRGPPPDGRRRPPPDGRRPPHPDGRQGPPPEGRRGPPPPDGRRGPPPPDGRRGPPPPDGRRGPPPPDGRRGPPPPDGYRRPPPDGHRELPPDYRGGPPPNGRRGPPPDRQGPPQGGRRSPPPDGNFRGVRVDRSKESESEI